jgi:hypothetical protein
MSRGTRQPFRGLSVVTALPHGAKTYYTVADTKTVKRYAVVAGRRVACSSCRSVECKHALYVKSFQAATPAERSEASKALIAEYDAMARHHREEIARRSGDVSIEGGANRDSSKEEGSGRPRGPALPSDLDSQSPAPSSSPARRKRRTKVEMAAARAAKSQQIAESYAALVPKETRDWLDEPDEALEAILRSEEPRD